MKNVAVLGDPIEVVVDTPPLRASASDPPPASSEASGPIGWLDAHRIVSLVAALGLLWPAVIAWRDIVAAPLPGLATIVMAAAALVLACLLAAARTEAELERLDRWLLVLGLLILGAWAASNLSIGSGYTTDEAAFVHGAASLLLHGRDPYGANLLPSLAKFGVPPAFWTYTMNGGAVSTLGYPALPVLVTAPFVSVLGDGQAVVVAALLALALAAITAFAVLPRTWRALAVVMCVAYPALEGFAVAGLTVVLMLPALIVVADRWARVGEEGRLSNRDRVGAAALGLVLATSQLGWFIAPFLLVGIVLLRTPSLGGRTACKVASRYLGVAGITFLALNGPFIVWGPAAWWEGVLAPITQHALPYGQGLIGLTTFLRIGGGDLNAYTYAAGALYLALMLVFAARFRILARACFLLPVVALYASGRSLSEYWLVLAAPAVVSAVATDSNSLRAAAELAWPKRVRVRLPAKAVFPALFAPAVAFFALALLSPAPLSINILRTQLDRQGIAVAQLWVDVRNRSDTRLRPNFATNSTGQASSFWRILAGPAVLAPGADASYVLRATDLAPVTSGSGAFLLQAVTGSPRTISSSSLFRPPLQQSW